MDKIERGNPLTQSADIVKENLETLKRLFPTIVKEGKIDVDELKALIDDEVETSEEYYRFTWAGKSEARREANKPSTGTLRPNKADSKDWDTTGNIFIEGDNLEVLKLMQKSYAGKIKMMYFDPPYNTGKDFVYKDNYADNLGNYLTMSKQTDDEGNKLSTNTESDGRFHSNWLNMMYPRLKLARNLLTEDGAAFISIDDNEVTNLRKLCDEIFGEENFIALLSVENNPKGRKNSKYISTSNDYCLIYAKNKEIGHFVENIPKSAADMTEDENGNFVHSSGKRVIVGENNFNKKITDLNSDKHFSVYYKKSNNDLIIKKEDSLNDIDLSLTNNGYSRFISFYEGVFVESTYTSKKIEELFKENALEFKNEKIYEKNFSSSIRMKSLLTNRDYEALIDDKKVDFKIDVKTTSAGTMLKELFNTNESIFTAPKNTGLVKLFTTLFEEKNLLVLDFFAGSATTAHAIMEQNNLDNGNRKFICVQIPEPTEEKSEAYKAGYKNIAEISKERIRRAGEKVKSELNNDLFSGNRNKLDIGFKAFKLDSSNIHSWDGSVENFEANLFYAQNNIKDDRTEEDVLFEILLKYGLDLTVPIQEKTIGKCKVYSIGDGVLFVCLSDNITTEVAKAIGEWKKDLEPATCRVLFKDNGFIDDVAKTNSVQILRQYGIEECNSI